MSAQDCPVNRIVGPPGILDIALPQSDPERHGFRAAMPRIAGPAGVPGRCRRPGPQPHPARPARPPRRCRRSPTNCTSTPHPAAQAHRRRHVVPRGDRRDPAFQGRADAGHHAADRDDRPASRLRRKRPASPMPSCAGRDCRPAPFGKPCATRRGVSPVDPAPPRRRAVGRGRSG